jgi:erythronate-4-phosphate dehydrogenase
MLNRELLDRLKATQFLVNSARGAVFDCRELKSALQERRIEGAVLEVWEGEPFLDFGLLGLLDIGTPHIAGAAWDGKIRAAEMARDALCGFFGIRSKWETDSLYPASRQISPERGAEGQAAVISVLLQAFDILEFDSALRSFGSAPRERAAAGFDHLHSKSPPRPEFRHFTVNLRNGDADLSETFSALGFKVSGAKP